MRHQEQLIRLEGMSARTAAAAEMRSKETTPSPRSNPIPRQARAGTLLSWCIAKGKPHLDPPCPILGFAAWSQSEAKALVGAQARCVTKQRNSNHAHAQHGWDHFPVSFCSWSRSPPRAPWSVVLRFSLHGSLRVDLSEHVWSFSVTPAAFAFCKGSTERE